VFEAKFTEREEAFFEKTQGFISRDMDHPILSKPHAGYYLVLGKQAVGLKAVFEQLRADRLVLKNLRAVGEVADGSEGVLFCMAAQAKTLMQFAQAYGEMALALNNMLDDPLEHDGDDSLDSLIEKAILRFENHLRELKGDTLLPPGFFDTEGIDPETDADLVEVEDDYDSHNSD
jgi:hypothetical protein